MGAREPFPIPYPYMPLHSLFGDFRYIYDDCIYIYSRSSRFVYPFSPYTPETPLKIILKVYSILGISGNFNVCGSSR